jgi:hypothetical protein
MVWDAQKRVLNAEKKDALNWPIFKAPKVNLDPKN